jgi:hypothetical protein
MTLGERFWSKVDKTKDCWNWIAAKNRGGYGQFRFEGKLHMAHRFIFQREIGELPPVVMHTCDNPSCVNPKHLVAGTVQSNNSDRDNKGRFHKLTGEQNGMSKLTSGQVASIRIEYATINTSYRKLAKKYLVDHSLIGYIINNKVWR